MAVGPHYQLNKLFTHNSSYLSHLIKRRQQSHRYSSREKLAPEVHDRLTLRRQRQNLWADFPVLKPSSQDAKACAASGSSISMRSSGPYAWRRG
ncbi:hypothetical protein OEZ85_009350 [Tetradesmus obliquus]|uniref:Uncharacterized protein n=1 Tax=Tetradesmus obliquus TaxID=3088 RepID=A0ABY8U8P7_TETOB|nr:hypothetical protein OEZ85_009350 [Tetradesmus obliquus]